MGLTLTRELAALVRRRNEAPRHYRLAIYHLGCTDHFASSLSYPAKSSGLTTSTLSTRFRQRVILRECSDRRIWKGGDPTLPDSSPAAQNDMYHFRLTEQ